MSLRVQRRCCVEHAYALAALGVRGQHQGIECERRRTRRTMRTSIASIPRAWPSKGQSGETSRRVTQALASIANIHLCAVSIHKVTHSICG